MDNPEKVACLLHYVGEQILLEREKGYSTTYKKDRTPVTTVDVLADKLIQNGLREIYGDIQIVSEETWNEDTQSLSSDGYFAIDPIDGTGSFVRSGDFCINVAYIHNNKPVDGWIATPTNSSVTYTDGLSVKKLQNNLIVNIEETVQKYSNDGLQNSYTMIANARSVVRNGTLLSVGDVKQSLIESGINISKVITDGVAATKYCMLVEGEGDFIMAFGKFMLWDIAAGQALVSRFGYEMIDESGKNITFATGKPYGVVFTHKNNHLRDRFLQLF